MQTNLVNGIGKRRALFIEFDLNLRNASFQLFSQNFSMEPFSTDLYLCGGDWEKGPFERNGVSAKRDWTLLGIIRNQPLSLAIKLTELWGFESQNFCSIKNTRWDLKNNIGILPKKTGSNWCEKYRYILYRLRVYCINNR